MSVPLLRTPYESFKPGFWMTLVYRFLVAFFYASGLWRRGRTASGDLATMTFLDKVYWLYKTIHPVACRFENHVAFADPGVAVHKLPTPDIFDHRRSISLSAAGDLIYHDFVRNSRGVLYEEIGDFLFGSDLSMANLECLIADGPEQVMKFSPKAGPTLTYSVEAFDIVRQHRGRAFGFLATACNHSLDLGESGVYSTVERLKSRHTAFNGMQADGHRPPEATVLDVAGIRLGIMAVTFGLNARRPPAGKPHMVHVTNLNCLPSEENLAVFSTLIHAEVDFRVVHLHWGMEHEFFPRPEQVEFAHRLSENGVDLIIGHHPHVIQPVEFYRTKRDRDRVVPIFYSLGNLINNYAAKYLCESLIARIQLVSGFRDGKMQVFVESVLPRKVKQVFDEQNSQVSLVYV